MSIAKFSASAIFSLALWQASWAQGPAPAPAVAPVAAVPAAPSQPAAVAMPGTSMTSLSAAEIQRISEDNTVLSARLGQLELKAKIAAKQKELASLDAGSQSPFGSAGGAPSVVSVSGLKGQLEAVLAFTGNVIQRVKVGDVIGDRKVTSISLNEVVLSDLKGKTQQRLAFGSSPVMRDVSQGPGAGLAVPAPQYPSMQIPQR